MPTEFSVSSDIERKIVGQVIRTQESGLYEGLIIQDPRHRLWSSAHGKEDSRGRKLPI